MLRGGQEVVPEFARMKKQMVVRMQIRPVEREEGGGRAWISEQKVNMGGLGQCLLQKSEVALEVSGTLGCGSYYDYSNLTVMNHHPIVFQTRREMEKHVQTLPGRLQGETPCRMT